MITVSKFKSNGKETYKTQISIMNVYSEYILTRVGDTRDKCLLCKEYTYDDLEFIQYTKGGVLIAHEEIEICENCGHLLIFASILGFNNL